MPSHENAIRPSTRRQPTDGRDHLNLAEFPISVLQRQQPADVLGRKLDTVVFQATRYDARLRRRVPQKVTLTTNSRAGLPTPADENVVLALLYIARQTDRFAAPRVHFTPYRLFAIMGWAANSRSYERLRAVLRRLKSLTVVYENAWWDNDGRRFEQEFATGIIAAYQIGRQTAGRTQPGAVPPSWVLWNPDFYQSLAAGSLKRLDLDRLFSLRLPTSQRMYRFLDKHFYHSATFELDLREFACGHIGLSDGYITPKLKSKLQPAIAELEGIGFIEQAAPEERYRKIRPGVWRIRFEKKAAAPPVAEKAETPGEGSGPLLARDLTDRGVTASTARKLAAGHSAQSIREKVAVLDWLVGRKDARVSRNPAGYLVESIRQDYAPPAGYEPAERRVARQAEQEAALQAARRRQSADERRRQEQESAVDDWLAARPAAERQEIERAALADGDNVLVKQFRRAADPESRATLRRIIVRAHAARIRDDDSGLKSTHS